MRDDELVILATAPGLGAQLAVTVVADAAIGPLLAPRDHGERVCPGPPRPAVRPMVLVPGRAAPAALWRPEAP